MEQNTSLLFYEQTWLTLLIQAVYRKCVIYELHKGPCSPWSLCGSMVKHQSVDSSWELRIFSFVQHSWPDEKHLSVKWLYLQGSMISQHAQKCVFKLSWDRWPAQLLNSLNLKRDKNSNSPYNITAESNIKVLRIEELNTY